MQQSNGSIGGLSSSETVKNITQNFQEAFKEMQSFQKAYQDFIKKITDLNKQLSQNTKNENPYELTLKEIEKEQSALDSEVKSYSDSKKRRLEIDKWLIGLKKVFVFLHRVHGGAIFDSNLRQQGMSQFNKYPTFAK